MKKRITDVLVAWGISMVVYLLWTMLELAFYGEVQPRLVDNVIGFILIASLWGNYKHWGS